MENFDVKKLNDSISDLSEPARSMVRIIVFLEKIRNQTLIVNKKMTTFFLKSITSDLETDDVKVGSGS